jgi:hypothetical protein
MLDTQREGQFCWPIGGQLFWPLTVVPPPDAANEASQASRPQVANTVARIEQGAKHFTLSADSLRQMLRFVLAFLLHNDLLGGRLHLFTDGYHSLQDTLLAFFAWHPRVWLVLDWYHVVKKFKADLSRACGAREVCDRHGSRLAGESPVRAFGRREPVGEGKGAQRNSRCYPRGINGSG